MEANIRILIITSLLFLSALVVSLNFKSTDAFFLGMPFSLCFDIATSICLCLYFSFETYILLKKESI